ncbi:heparan-alpha-glucosaminide N-acetyltransferase-like protein (DUF1624) [Rhynchospora pubera]|uniref:Heparan-alpha-glucosaminide N-acetyltransferase-like protein (DUF1624) n=1 Tax=Rhynchospora pubera TaxID=906938 RepID=A0AAV8GGY4_9POAL|nr:heparan-alpha-glucosaminide N-acetyltransferase-like protein (DUF1624) [Rhynchospora pubera]
MASEDLVRRSAADVKDDDQLPISSRETETLVDEKTQKPKRVASVDMFRGLTVGLMVLVDGAGGEWPRIGHAPWFGCNLADFVMPFFLFIVGIAIPLSLKRIPHRGKAVRRLLLRTIKLFFWGFLLQGGYSHAPDELSYGVDMKHIRWCGILQRIALAYLVVAVLEIVTKEADLEDKSTAPFFIYRKYYRQWIVAACILIIYMSLLYGIYVPDWEFRVQYDTSPYYGKVFKACTEVSPYEGPFKADAPAWCLAPFEPEGILSSVSAILSTIIGVHYGHVLVHLKEHRDRLKHWLSMGVALLILGFVLHFSHAIPLNKQLYTFSYVCVTAGAAALVFSLFYFLVDIVGIRSIFLPLEWIGMNAMLVYVMAAEGIFEGFLNGWYYESTNNTLVYWVKKHVFVKVWHSQRVGVLLYVLFAQILFWGIVAGILHRVGIYWKL